MDSTHDAESLTSTKSTVKLLQLDGKFVRDIYETDNTVTALYVDHLEDVAYWTLANQGHGVVQMFVYDLKDTDKKVRVNFLCV